MRAPAGVPLKWIFLSGAVTGGLTLLLQRLVIFGYVYGHVFFLQTVPEAGRLGRFVGAVASWGTPALHVSLTFLFAFWLARNAGARPVRCGLAVGVVSAISNQLIVLLIYPPVLPAELLQYLVLGAAAGTLGGYLARRTVAGRESLYRASRAIGSAQNPEGVAEAIGKHLSSSETREIGLWGIPRQNGKEGLAAELVILGSWRPHGLQNEVLGTRLDTGRVPEIEGLNAGSPLTVRTRDLPAKERAVLQKASIRSVMFVPLGVPGDRLVGLLSVASRRRYGPSRGAARAYMTIATQAALAIENSRLMEEARSMGQQAGIMRERQRLAHEIHDALAQSFTSVVTNAQAADAALPEDTEATRLHHRQIVRTAREGLSEARRMVQALRPEPLEKASLPEALSNLVRRWSEESRIPASSGITGTYSPLPPDVEAALLRVAQESLTNVRKYARANRTALTLSYMGDLVSLDVRDDGVGFEPDAARPPGSSTDGGGFGLGAMRERMSLLGGTLVVESAPGEGTTITAEIPMAAYPDPGGSYEARNRRSFEPTGPEAGGKVR